MSEIAADTVVILSSELIAKITQEYFNKTMFKQRVEIVDLKPTEDGYMFSVAFVEKVEPQKGKEVVGIDRIPTQEEYNTALKALAGNGSNELLNEIADREFNKIVDKAVKKQTQDSIRYAVSTSNVPVRASNGRFVKVGNELK